MKINVCYKIIATVDMEVSNEFKALETMRFATNNDIRAWEKMADALDNIILRELPEDAEILGVVDTDTNEIVYEN